MDHFFFLLGDAFIRMHDFYQALIICIRSIESNEPSLLANIDPNLVNQRRDCSSCVFLLSLSAVWNIQERLRMISSVDHILR